MARKNRHDLERRSRAGAADSSGRDATCHHRSPRAGYGAPLENRKDRRHLDLLQHTCGQFVALASAGGYGAPAGSEEPG